MYGHGHNQHNASYTSSEANYYNYNNDSCPQNHMPQIPSSHYTSNYPYEDPSYIYGENAETPPSPQELNYYHHHVAQNVPQENPIISTETGLSYTNLDYGTNPSPGVYPINHQPVYPDGYQRSQDMMIRQQEIDNHHLNYIHENKYLPQIENDSYSHPHLVPTNTACMEYQHHHRFKEEGLTPADMDRHHHQQHVMHNISSVPQPQPVIPTYKWMQVKRNVPKPTGKF